MFGTRRKASGVDCAHIGSARPAKTPKRCQSTNYCLSDVVVGRRRAVFRSPGLMCVDVRVGSTYVMRYDGRALNNNNAKCWPRSNANIDDKHCSCLLTRGEASDRGIS